jgi:hypothetical protein
LADPSRREVTVWLVGAAAGALVAQGCGGPDGSRPDGGEGAGADGGLATDAGVADAGQSQDGGQHAGSCADGAKKILIGTNTGHAFMVSAQDILAGQARSYDIRGSATHTHTVHLSGDDFAALSRGETVQVQSTRDVYHSHAVTVSCG